MDAVALSADIVDEEVVEAAPVEAAEEAVEASAVPLPDDSTEVGNICKTFLAVQDFKKNIFN